MEFLTKNRHAFQLGKGRNWNRILGTWLLGGGFSAGYTLISLKIFGKSVETIFRRSIPFSA